MNLFGLAATTADDLVAVLGEGAIDLQSLLQSVVTGNGVLGKVGSVVRTRGHGGDGLSTGGLLVLLVSLDGLLGEGRHRLGSVLRSIKW